jgi:hypothetical protein
MRTLVQARRTAVILSFTAFAGTAGEMRAQSVPVVDVPAAKARTSVRFGSVLGIHETGNTVLVNDSRNHLLLAYDTTLTKSRIVFDSVGGMPNSYGSYQMALNIYAGDSTIVPDLDARTLLVLDGNGKVARTFALPFVMDVASFANAVTGIDSKGRLLYAAGGFIKMPPPGKVGPQEVFVDSNPILRADLDARRVDTVARVANIKGEYSRIDRTEVGKIIRTALVNPLPTADQWTVISDGSIALVRGFDYHIDWIRPDGTKASTPKLPFDWKRVTDEEKQKLIDSTLNAHAAQNKLAADTRNAPPPPRPPIDPATGQAARTGGGAGISRAAYDAAGNLWVPMNYEVVPMKDIPDYYPALRQGAVLADRDNNLWILPTTSAQSKNGELVYDVINNKGELFQRVRVPLGRLIAGFGKDGVVYLIEGDRTKGFFLERTRLPIR